MSGRDCLAHASLAACLPVERALIGCCSMDGKGAWRDNVFVERFWRTIKYEEVYLRAYDGVEEARQSIGRYIAFYNARRPHAALDGRTPDQAYSQRLFWNYCMRASLLSMRRIMVR
jgi:hypothetical protein